MCENKSDWSEYLRLHLDDANIKLERNKLNTKVRQLPTVSNKASDCAKLKGFVVLTLCEMRMNRRAYAAAQTNQNNYFSHSSKIKVVELIDHKLDIQLNPKIFQCVLLFNCRLLMSFVNRLDPDQARQNVGPDLDPNCLTIWWYYWKKWFWKWETMKKHAI